MQILSSAIHPCEGTHGLHIAPFHPRKTSRSLSDSPPLFTYSFMVISKSGEMIKSIHESLNFLPPKHIQLHLSFVTLTNTQVSPFLTSKLIGLHLSLTLIAIPLDLAVVDNILLPFFQHFYFTHPYLCPHISFQHTHTHTLVP